MATIVTQYSLRQRFSGFLCKRQKYRNLFTYFTHFTFLIVATAFKSY